MAPGRVYHCKHRGDSVCIRGGDEGTRKEEEVRVLI